MSRFLSGLGLLGLVGGFGLVGGALSHTHDFKTILNDRSEPITCKYDTLFFGGLRYETVEVPPSSVVSDLERVSVLGETVFLSGYGEVTIGGKQIVLEGKGLDTVMDMLVSNCFGGYGE